MSRAVDGSEAIREVVKAPLGKRIRFKAKVGCTVVNFNRERAIKLFGNIDEHVLIFSERLQLFGGSSFENILVALFFDLR